MEREILQVIEGEKKAPLLQALLRGMSCGFHAGVMLKNFAYDAGLLEPVRAALPVVSIGNIVAGGTGKTPFVLFLAKELLKICKVAIISRGYRSQTEKTKEVVQVQSSSCPMQCGDEPLFLARKLEEAPVFVGKRRKAAAQLAAAQGAKIILLDDGMQHRKLFRDVEIVVLDGSDLFGKGFYLPRGFLRDSPKRLKEADYLVVNGMQKGCQEALQKWSKAPLIGVQTFLANGDEIRGKKVGLFCAIARPARFVKSVQEAGAEVVETLTALDHSRITEQELQEFGARCKTKGAECLVCTEKDGVKYSLALDLSLPVIILQAELKIVFGQDNFSKLMEQIRSCHHERSL
jgi:tetraacyldisaccharide 4'-kinase